MKIRVQEVFTHGEGINTPCARHKGQQPLIECAKMCLQYYFFPFLRILRCDEEFNPRSSLSMNVLCVKLILCFFERFILIANKNSFKALDLEMMF